MINKNNKKTKTGNINNSWKNSIAKMKRAVYIRGIRIPKNVKPSKFQAGIYHRLHAQLQYFNIASFISTLKSSYSNLDTWTGFQ